MFGFTVYVADDISSPHGFKEIHWKCLRCHKFISLPKEQRFRYCPHCGRKILFKVDEDGEWL